ncbi:MAG: calcium:proton antiporter [Bdellovibrionales bacterium]
MKKTTRRTVPSLFRQEWFLGIGFFTCLAFFVHGPAMSARLASPFWLIFLFIWLFTVILGSALYVVRHADALAARLGEPFGTLILTLSVTSIEIVAISAIMLHGDNNPTLVRDTLFSVVTIILNGMVGVSLLIGAWRHREQQYNLQGANAYLGVIIPLAVLSLILPNFTVSTSGPTLSFAQGVFLIVVSISLYSVFLGIQTSRHRGYFILGEENTANHTAGNSKSSRRSVWHHALLLAANMTVVVFLAEHLAHPVDYFIETLHAPAAVGGLIMALLVATPEAIGAVRAANANHLQRAVNIFLGSVLSTIGLTVPVMLAIGYLTGHTVILGLNNADSLMLALTLLVSVVTFASGRTNVLQGTVHIILFAAYLLLIFQG